MEIKNISTGKVYPVKKSDWEKMDKKYQKLFDITDANDKPEPQPIFAKNRLANNIEVENTVKAVENKIKVNPNIEKLH